MLKFTWLILNLGLLTVNPKSKHITIQISFWNHQHANILASAVLLSDILEENATWLTCESSVKSVMSLALRKTGWFLFANTAIKHTWLHHVWLQSEPENLAHSKRNNTAINQRNQTMMSNLKSDDVLKSKCLRTQRLVRETVLG